MSWKCSGLVAAVRIQASVTSGTNSDWSLHSTWGTERSCQSRGGTKWLIWSNRSCRAVSTCAHPTRWMVSSAVTRSMKQKSARKGTARRARRFSAVCVVPGCKLATGLEQKALPLLDTLAFRDLRNRAVAQPRHLGQAVPFANRVIMRFEDRPAQRHQEDRIYVQGGLPVVMFQAGQLPDPIRGKPEFHGEVLYRLWFGT